MRIVFWGSERESSVTSNMLIVATYLACHKGYRSAMVELAEEKQEMENYFSKREDKRRMKKYISTLIKRQLYYVSIKEWKQKAETTALELIRYLELNMDIVFINLANRTDEDAKELMRKADLVVVNLRQRHVDFDRYYAKYANLSKQIFLLIGNYYENEFCNKETLQKKYRIPKGELAVIPYNPEYQIACDRKCLERYIRRLQFQFMSAIKDYFITEVGNAAEKICDAASEETE